MTPLTPLTPDSVAKSAKAGTMAGMATVNEIAVECRAGIRERLGFSKAHVARIARVTPEAVGVWERGGYAKVRSDTRVAVERLEATYRWMMLAE